MTDSEAQRALVATVVAWISTSGGTEEFAETYWSTRRDLLDTNPGAFDGPVGAILSHMDVALHSYWPEPDGEGEIGEAELRREMRRLLVELETLGFAI